MTRAEADRVFWCWLLDRAERYRNDSCCRAVFDELLKGVYDGEHWAAAAHGELEDLASGFDRGRAAATRALDEVE